SVIPTTTTVTSSTSGNTSVYGQPLTFTASVAPAPGFATPTGTVTFDVNGAQAAQVALSGGIAQFTPATALTPGSYTITAFYAGYGHDLPSDNTASPLIQTINKDATTTTVASSTAGSPSAFGQAVTLTATVMANSPGAGNPTGTVTFYDAGSAIGTAAYTSGDGDFTASPTSTAITQTVQKASTTTALASSVNPTVYGQATKFT